MNKSRIAEPRIRRSAKATEMAKLRTQRRKALKAGNAQESDRLEGILGRMAGM
jgi:hypothetical protein